MPYQALSADVISNSLQKHLTNGVENRGAPGPSGVDDDTDKEDQKTYDRRTDDHMKDLKEFQRKFRETLPHLNAETPRYDRVKALLLSWEETDVGMMRQGAQELERVLKGEYGYDVKYEAIASEYPTSSLSVILGQEIPAIGNKRKTEKRRAERNLFILYYGGHAIMRKGTCYWKPYLDTADEDSIDWTWLQDMLKQFNCDVMLILDCCQSAAMMKDDFRGKQRFEVLTSAGIVEKASALKKSSFTFALSTELKLLRPSAPVSAVQLHAVFTRAEKVVETYHLAATPQYQAFSEKTQYGSIALIPLTQAELTTAEQKAQIQRNNEQKLSSDARMLIKIAFRNIKEAPILELWKLWYRARPPNITSFEMQIRRQVELVALFESDSLMALVTMPIYLWDFFPRHSAIHCLGIVRSANLLPSPSFLIGDTSTYLWGPPPDPDLSLLVGGDTNLETEVADERNLPREPNAKMSSPVKSSVRFGIRKSLQSEARAGTGQLLDSATLTKPRKETIRSKDITFDMIYQRTANKFTPYGPQPLRIARKGILA